MLFWDCLQISASFGLFSNKKVKKATPPPPHWTLYSGIHGNCSRHPQNHKRETLTHLFWIWNNLTLATSILAYVWPHPPPDKGKTFFLCQGEGAATRRLRQSESIILRFKGSLFNQWVKGCRTEVVAVGWEPQNNSPVACVRRWIIYYIILYHVL